MTFHDHNITPAAGFQTGEFGLRPIVVADAQLDYDAVMASRESLRKWEQSTWPEDDFTVEANRDDMVKLEQRHTSGESFCYTVTNPEQTECLGCVYIFSPNAKWFEGEVTALGSAAWSDIDAMVFFWVRESRVATGMDTALLASMRTWFADDWPFDRLVFVTNEQFEQQVALMEGTDLQQGFEIKLPKDPGRYLAYA